MTITTQVGATCYRQDPDAPWQIQIQTAPGKRWVWHCDCATAEEARRKVIRLGRNEQRRKGDKP